MIDRPVAYADAGADCFYAPGIEEDPRDVAAVVAAVEPKPVNELLLWGRR